MPISDMRSNEVSAPLSDWQNAALAGFWRRVFAHFLDSIPITLLVVSVFHFTLVLDISRHFSRYRTPREDRDRFLVQQVASLVLLIYGAIMEASALRGTFGKLAIGIAVVDREGRRIGFWRSVLRNLCKPLSYVLCGLGCLWVVFSPEKRAWHDYLSGTWVVCRPER